MLHPAQHFAWCTLHHGLPWWLREASVYNVGDPGSSPGLGRSPGEGNGNPLQYSCLENPMDRGAWWATVYGVTKCRTRLSDFASLHSADKLNKQDDNIKPCHTPFLIWNQSIISCPVLTVASWPTHSVLRRQVRWSGIPISFRIFHSLLWSTQRLLHSQ